MMRTVLFCVVALTIVSQCSAGGGLHALFAKGGPSYFFGTQLGSVGGSPGSSSWHIGPSIGLGVQFPRSEDLSLVLMFQHSWHSFKPAERTTVEGSPKAKATEVTFYAKYGGGEVYLLGGLGYSFQHRDDANFVTSLGYAGTVNGGEQTMFILLVGLGGTFRVSPSFAVIVEGTFRFRTYSSLALEIGIEWDW